jgi:hypothetical protein
MRTGPSDHAGRIGGGAALVVVAVGLVMVVLTASCSDEGSAGNRDDPAPARPSARLDALETSVPGAGHEGGGGQPPAQARATGRDSDGARSAPAHSSAATTRPASAPAFQPLTDAAVGEWAEYAVLDDRVLRYDVVERTASVVTTQVTVRQGGKPLGLPASRRDPADLDPPARQAEAVGADRTSTRAEIDVAGRTWAATLYEHRWTDEDVQYLRQTWVSPDVPVFGTVRMALYGDGELEARLELTGFGKSE